MAKPTNQFLIDYNADLASKVTDQTEIVTVVTRVLWSKTTDIEESIVLSINGTLKKMWADCQAEGVSPLNCPVTDYFPDALIIKSINGVEVSHPDREVFIPDTPAAGQKIIDITVEELARKPVDVSVLDGVLNRMLTEDIDGSDPQVQQVFVTETTAFGTNVVVSKYVDFTVVA